MPLSVLLQKQIEICLSPPLSVPQSPWSSLPHPPFPTNKQTKQSKTTGSQHQQKSATEQSLISVLANPKKEKKISATRNGALFLLLCALHDGFGFRLREQRPICCLPVPSISQEEQHGEDHLTLLVASNPLLNISLPVAMLLLLLSGPLSPLHHPHPNQCNAMPCHQALGSH